MPLEPAKDPISSKGVFQFAYPAALGYMAIMGRYSAKGAVAIYLSRLKNAIAHGIKEFEEARKEVLHDHAKLKPLPAEAADNAEQEMELDDKGNVQFTSPEAAKACVEELGRLTDELPVVVDLNNTNLRKAAERVLKILTSDDCPDIKNDDWAHERLVAELELALATEEKADK
jgi:hypothetical protein